MSKKKSNNRGNMQRRPKKPKLEVNSGTFGDISDADMAFAEAHFSNMSGPLEPLTDELIDELVAADKFPRERLIEARDMGMQYSRKRNSFWAT